MESQEVYDHYWEKVAIAERGKFSENLNKLFSKADEIFNKNDKQKPSVDDIESLSKPDEMTIPQAKVKLFSSIFFRMHAEE